MKYLKSVQGSLHITASNCGFSSHIYFIVSMNTNDLDSNVNGLIYPFQQLDGYCIIHI